MAVLRLGPYLLNRFLIPLSFLDKLSCFIKSTFIEEPTPFEFDKHQTPSFEASSLEVDEPSSFEATALELDKPSSFKATALELDKPSSFKASSLEPDEPSSFEASYLELDEPSSF